VLKSIRLNENEINFITNALCIKSERLYSTLCTAKEFNDKIVESHISKQIDLCDKLIVKFEEEQDV
jgi:hypothetical protein